MLNTHKTLVVFISIFGILPVANGHFWPFARPPSGLYLELEGCLLHMKDAIRYYKAALSDPSNIYVDGQYYKPNIKGRTQSAPLQEARDSILRDYLHLEAYQADLTPSQSKKATAAWASFLKILKDNGHTEAHSWALENTKDCHL